MRRPRKRKDENVKCQFVGKYSKKEKAKKLSGILRKNIVEKKR